MVSVPIVFAPALLKRGEQKLTCEEAQQSIPSFYSDGLETHIQNYPWADIRYATYPISTMISRFQMSDSMFEFEFAKSGFAPVDPQTGLYLNYTQYEVRDCIHANIRSQRFVTEMQAIIVINMMIPAWGCLHSRAYPHMFAFFRCFPDAVDMIQLDSVWTRYCIPFRYQFSNCDDGRFSHASTVRVFVEHHACSGDWKIRGNVFRFNSHFTPSKVSRPAVQACENPQSSVVPAGYVQVSFHKMSEELSATRLSNVKTNVSSNASDETSSELFERRT